MTMTTTASEETTTATDVLIWCFVFCKAKSLETVEEKLYQWFADREGAYLLHRGYGEKKGQGVLILELTNPDDDYGWLAEALNQERGVIDYTFYGDDLDEDTEEEEED
jgi:hypothetical protein